MKGSGMGGMTENECRLLMEAVSTVHHDVAHLRGDFQTGLAEVRGDVQGLRDENSREHNRIWKKTNALPCQNPKDCPTLSTTDGNPHKTGLFWRAVGKIFHLG